MTEEKKEVIVPEKFKDLVSMIEKMSVLDLSELVKVLENKFGVSASVPMGMVASSPVAGEGNAEVEEKDSFTIELKSGGAQKIQVIKVVREVLGLGLKEAKDLVDAAPKPLKEGMRKAEAEELKKKIEAAGGQAELK
ncbi:MAG: 50S ribosomal protein L7/L12 [Candidatus Niyogibacteria bacterium]|nr:50S ribosomal protein L7/L12 [Candidatus Niyogibacteria bacterium]